MYTGPAYAHGPLLLSFRILAPASETTHCPENESSEHSNVIKRCGHYLYYSSPLLPISPVQCYLRRTLSTFKLNVQCKPQFFRSSVLPAGANAYIHISFTCITICDTLRSSSGATSDPHREYRHAGRHRACDDFLMSPVEHIKSHARSVF